MAAELKLTITAAFARGSLKESWNNGQQSIDVATTISHGSVVSVGTSEEDLAIGDITAASQGYIFLKNLDATNFVKYGPKSAGSMIEFGRLGPGQETVLRLGPSVVLRWIADTAACSVKVLLFQV